MLQKLFGDIGAVIFLILLVAVAAFLIYIKVKSASKAKQDMEERGILAELAGVHWYGLPANESAKVFIDLSSQKGGERIFAFKYQLALSTINYLYTLILSVVLFVVIPLAGGILTRLFVSKKRGLEYFEKQFLPKFDGVTTVGLLLTLILLFAFQGDIIVSNPLHIILIAIPLTIQTFLIFFIAYLPCKWLKLPHDIAAPAGMIGASNFFELAVAVAIALFGTTSPAALATTVGVLTEVPVMLILVKIANKTTHWFPAPKTDDK